MNILTKILGFFIGGATASAGGAVTSAAVVATSLAALYPAFHWFTGHKDETFLTITLTYGESAFYAAIVLVLLKVAQKTQP